MNAEGPLVALLAVVSTLTGGLFAMRLRTRATAIMAFTGGVVLGVALLDVLPEAADRIASPGLLGGLVGAGFLWFFVLSRLIVLHHRDEPEIAAGHPQVGALAAGALSFHSLQDGFALGASFVVSPALGVAVAIAVIGHDFADGMNTVTFVLSQRGELSSARRWLAVDALAPAVGALVGSFVAVSDHVAGIGLAIYCGIFLSIGAGELLPEAHEEPDAGRVALTLLGFAAMLAATRIASL
jgi:ZIP family zinc transporter